MKKMITSTYELNIRKSGLNQASVRLAFLSDLHNQENGAGNENLLAAIREAKPDLILCGGDMLVGDISTPIDAAKDFMLKLAEEYPIYHALGNHESRLKKYPHQFGPKYSEYKSILEKAGVNFLDNDRELITIKGIPFVLAGYSLPLHYYKRTHRKQINALDIRMELGQPEKRAVNILMAHHPDHLESYANWGADLALCGHYHGGIVRLGEHTGLITPNIKLFNRRCVGMFTFKERQEEGRIVPYDSYAIVSAGLGEHTLPLRFHNPRELVIADLHISET